MKFKTIPLFLLFLFVASTTVFAHPPTEINLAYNIQTQQILVEGKHKTDDPDEDYLKKMIFYVNGEEAQVQYFQRQRSRVDFTAEVVITAEEGDVIEVKIYSAEGGSKKASVTVEAAAKEEGESSAEPAKNSFHTKSKKGSDY